MKQQLKHYCIAVIALLALLLIGGAAFVYSGSYNIGADAHHTRPVYALMQALRERSIRVHSEAIQVPNLEDPQLILKGAGQYAAMCTGCHLKPGASDSEIRPGLYPQPPKLSQLRVDPRAAFWVIKHGIKMSAMPAWGASHDDPTIWSMVAFLQKLPGMTPQQYSDMVAKAPPDEDMDMGDGDGSHHHGHDGGEAQEHQQDGGGGIDMPEHENAGHSHAHAGAGAPSSTTQTGSTEGYTPGAAPDAEAAVQAFHGALEHGDRTIVMALLTPDAIISEGGRTQSPQEYAAHHLDDDAAFLQKAKVVPLWMGSMPMGDSAMVASESRILTTDKGKPIAVHSREQVTLKKVGSAWKISAVQWQSSPETTPP